MQAKAQAKAIKITPRKLGLVAGLVRLRRVEDSLVILGHTPKRGARMLAEVIKSAQANAENNHKLDSANLVVDSILVGPGPTLKRFRPSAGGRIHPINYRTTNVTVVLDELEAKPAASSQAKPRSKTEVK